MDIPKAECGAGDAEGGLLWTGPGEPGAGGSRASGRGGGDGGLGHKGAAMGSPAQVCLREPSRCPHTFRFR